MVFVAVNWYWYWWLSLSVLLNAYCIVSKFSNTLVSAPFKIKWNSIQFNFQFRYLTISILYIYLSKTLLSHGGTKKILISVHNKQFNLNVVKLLVVWQWYSCAIQNDLHAEMLWFLNDFQHPKYADRYHRFDKFFVTAMESLVRLHRSSQNDCKGGRWKLDYRIDIRYAYYAHCAFITLIPMVLSHHHLVHQSISYFSHATNYHEIALNF